MDTIIWTLYPILSNALVHYFHRRASQLSIRNVNEDSATFLLLRLFPKSIQGSIHWKFATAVPRVRQDSPGPRLTLEFDASIQLSSCNHKTEKNPEKREKHQKNCNKLIFHSFSEKKCMGSDRIVKLVEKVVPLELGLSHHLPFYLDQ